MVLCVARFLGGAVRGFQGVEHLAQGADAGGLALDLEETGTKKRRIDLFFQIVRIFKAAPLVGFRLGKIAKGSPALDRSSV